MPIYEYRCAECGFQDEFLQKHSDPQLTVCPSCGKETFKKMLSAAGFQLKGSGWYATDFKGSGSKPAAKSADAKTEAGSGDKPASDAGGEKTADKSVDKSADKAADKAAPASKPEPAKTSG